MARYEQIGIAGIADLGAIVEIEGLCFGAERFSRRQLRYLITRARGAFYVVRDGGRAVAYMSLLTPGRGHYVRIYSVAVHPSSRGRGLAGELVLKAVEYAGASGRRGVSLEVRTDNRAAIRLYEKEGFVVSGIRRGYYEDGGDAFGMVFNLG